MTAPDDEAAAITRSKGLPTEPPVSPDYFFAKVVDGGTPGGNGDQIAVLGNEGPTDASGDYDMSLGSGTVTSGDLVVH